MANINMRCKCGNNVVSSAGDYFQGNILRWYISYKCEKCGSAVEYDDIDEIPNEIKDAIIKEEGMWGIFVKEKKELIKVTYILKKELGFTLEHIKEVKDNFPRELIKGTKNEINRINNILINKGITNVEIRKV